MYLPINFKLINWIRHFSFSKKLTCDRTPLPLDNPLKAGTMFFCKKNSLDRLCEYGLWSKRYYISLWNAQLARCEMLLTTAFAKYTCSLCLLEFKKRSFNNFLKIGLFSIFLYSIHFVSICQTWNLLYF